MAASGSKPALSAEFHSSQESGRGERIRTFDLLNPIQVRYQTALRPDADESTSGAPDLRRIRRPATAGGSPVCRYNNGWVATEMPASTPAARLSVVTAASFATRRSEAGTLCPFFSKRNAPTNLNHGTARYGSHLAFSVA